MAEHQLPPILGVTVVPLPILGCNDRTTAEFPTDGSALPLESALWPPPKPPWAGSSTEKSGMALPMEVSFWHGIGPTENSGANYQNTNVNYVFAKTNTPQVFAKTNTPQIPNVAAIAVGNTPSAAHAHRKEMESMRRDGSWHPDDLARVLARENYKECLSQNGLSKNSPNVVGSTSKPPWSGSSTEKSGMTPPNEKLRHGPYDRSYRVLFM